jgi:lysyl-tRNA synthetase class II
VEELRSKGIEPYAYKWDRTHTANQLQDIYKHLGNGEESNSEGDDVSIAGRIVARRAFGKLAFLTIRDDSGTIQVLQCLLCFVVYFRVDVTDPGYVQYWFHACYIVST